MYLRGILNSQIMGAEESFDGATAVATPPQGTDIAPPQLTDTTQHHLVSFMLNMGKQGQLDSVNALPQAITVDLHLGRGPEDSSTWTTHAIIQYLSIGRDELMEALTMGEEAIQLKLYNVEIARPGKALVQRMTEELVESIETVKIPIHVIAGWFRKVAKAKLEDQTDLHLTQTYIVRSPRTAAISS